MLLKYRATITFDCKDNHPDDTTGRALEFTDTYTIDTNRFGLSDPEEIHEWIEHDLSLVAGGGYATDTIDNVKFNIQAI